MTTELRLPQAGMSMTEGTVSVWHKAIGDRVAEGELLADVEAAKSIVEVVAPVDGVLLEILVNEGELVPVRTVLALIGEPAETAEPAVSAEPAPAAAADPPATRPADPPRQITPVARQLARTLGVELDAVVGSGPGGRVVEADVRAAAEAVPPAATRRLTTSADPAVRADPVAPADQVDPPARASLTLMAEVDVTELVGRRSAINRTFAVTYSDFLIRAAVLALRDHPQLNATIEGIEIRPQRSVHVAIAGERADGPVLRDADRLTLRQVASQSGELVAAGGPSAGDPAPATFSIANLGAFGIDAFTPLRRGPGVAILGVGRIREHAVRESGGSIGWRKLVTLSVTVDHRAVDETSGALFLQSVAAALANVDGLLEGS